MAEINEAQIEEIVAQVIRNLQNDGQRLSPATPQPAASSASDTGIFATVDQAIAAAKAAQVEFVKAPALPNVGKSLKLSSKLRLSIQGPLQKSLSKTQKWELSNIR